MKTNFIQSDGLHNGEGRRIAVQKKGARDADVLLLLWEGFRTRANEIDQLLDLSLSILASANDFPQKTELKSALEKALTLIRVGSR